MDGTAQSNSLQTMIIIIIIILRYFIGQVVKTTFLLIEILHSKKIRLLLLLTFHLWITHSLKV